MSLSCLGLAGCTLFGPHLETPTVPTPQSWSAQGDASTALPSRWIASWDNPQLLALLERADAQNNDLRAAAQRLESALAAARISAANAWPSLAATASGSRSRNHTGPAPTAVHSTRFGIGLALDWEVDLWGRLRDDRAAARADATAAIADYRAARLSLLASVARTWFTLIATNAQLDLAERTHASFQQTADRASALYLRGTADALDVQLLESQAAAARANSEALRRQRDATARALNLLLGNYPDARIEAPDALPPLPAAIPVGVPADFLRNRPDILGAEAALNAAALRAKVAHKAQLPAIALTASAGTASAALSDLNNGDFRVWNLIGNLTAPLFQGGRIRASMAQATAAYHAAASTYVQTCLRGFREVEDALSAEQQLRAELAALSDAAASAAAAEALAAERYRRGMVDVTTLLNAQRSALTAQASLIQALTALHLNRLDLLLSLGGDPLASAPTQLSTPN